MQEFRIDPQAESIFESLIFEFRRVSSLREIEEAWDVSKLKVVPIRVWDSIHWMLQLFLKIGLIYSCMIVNMRSYKVTSRLLIIVFVDRRSNPLRYPLQSMQGPFLGQTLWNIRLRWMRRFLQEIDSKESPVRVQG